jgi:hypothetical protein
VLSERTWIFAANGLQRPHAWEETEEIENYIVS